MVFGRIRTGRGRLVFAGSDKLPPTPGGCATGTLPNKSSLTSRSSHARRTPTGRWLGKPIGYTLQKKEAIIINYELDGKVAVITGGASGIGLACSHTMARSGADVSIWDISDDALSDAAAEL